MGMKLFSATWCKFCAPVKDFILENDLDVEIVDIDDNYELASNYQVSQIPALAMEEGDLLLESDAILEYLENLCP